MQDRIKELAVEAGLHINGQTSEQRMAACERFAQAVARDIADWYATTGWYMDEDDVPAAIRARFGLGE